MRAFYNEIDSYCCDWLSNLMDASHITPGVICDKSIEDVFPDELRGFDRCHFFAGIGIWDYALNLAGWGERPVWTGSAPCQPFSAAGKGAGFADERHLWPAWAWLVGECRPPVILGEQVASKDIDPWIDLVQTDLEAMGYAIGCVPFPSAGVGAPHIRDRAYFMAYADSTRSLPRAQRRVHRRKESAGARHGEFERRGSVGIVADTDIVIGRQGSQIDGRRDSRSDAIARARPCGDVVSCELADTQCAPGRPEYEHEPGRRPEGPADAAEPRSDGEKHIAGPTNGFWRAADWLLCRDGKWRPVEPGYEQMADGSAGSLGRVRAGAVEEITEEINAWAIRHQTDAGEALRRVWADLQSQALCEREAGRLSGVRSPAVLLAFLRQLTDQGWRFSVSLACSGAEASQIVMRVMQFDGSAARTPLRRELEEQLAGQPADPLQGLSSIVAHHAAECWGGACRKKAGAASFPLATGAESRVGRLRAYGNAINAQAAAEFIRAAREAIDLTA